MATLTQELAKQAPVVQQSSSEVTLSFLVLSARLEESLNISAGANGTAVSPKQISDKILSDMPSVISAYKTYRTITLQVPRGDANWSRDLEARIRKRLGIKSDSTKLKITSP